MQSVGYMIKPDLSLASYRYRVMIPSRVIRKQFTVQQGVGDVTVFSKHWSKTEAEYAMECQEKGIRVLFDVCDDHFNDEFSDHYRRMIDLADRITCPTEAMRKRILEVTGKPATVIPDPYEYPIAEPKKPEAIRRVLWFGNPEFEPLKLIGAMGNRTLMCVSKEEPKIPCQFMPWSRDRMLTAFKWADAVIIPMTDTTKNACRSPNRLVESVRQGRFVVASPVAEYGNYGMWTGDIQEGLDWLEKNIESSIVAVGCAQSKVELLHSPQIIGAQWAKVFQEMLSGNYDTCGTEKRSLELA